MCSHFFFVFFSEGTLGLDLQGPVFSHEPPHKNDFSNSTGGHIECSGHGSPQPEVSEYFNKVTHEKNSTDCNKPMSMKRFVSIVKIIIHFGQRMLSKK